MLFGFRCCQPTRDLAGVGQVEFWRTRESVITGTKRSESVAYSPEKIPSLTIRMSFWDAFYVYGPDAQWTTKPEPLIVSGSTVLDDFDSLKSKLLPLLTDK
jgi:hypothetical protein